MGKLAGRTVSYFTVVQDTVLEWVDEKSYVLLSWTPDFGQTKNFGTSHNMSQAIANTNATIPVLYDETFHGRHDPSPSIQSMGQVVHLFGRLEHHDKATDGSFAICIAGGSGTFIRQDLYESIPEAHRPPLRTEDAGPVTFLVGSQETTLGTTIFPFILKDSNGSPFIMKLLVHVLPRLLMGMFIGTSTARYLVSTVNWNPITFEFDLHGQVIRVVGERRVVE